MNPNKQHIFGDDTPRTRRRLEQRYSANLTPSPIQRSGTATERLSRGLRRVSWRVVNFEYDPADIHARHEDGSTPLLLASRGHRFKDGSVLRLLLEHGIDLNAQNGAGWTPLHWVSMDGALEVVRLLLEHGADVEVKINVGLTALQLAADEGHDEVVKLLRKHGTR
jgi:ankyrin repeat protein